MWTKLMCRIYALIHIRDYRNKSIRNVLIFLSVFGLLCELSMIGKWDLVDIGITAGCGTLLTYFGSGTVKQLIKEWKK